MATLVLGAVGSAIGGSIGGGLLGISAVTIGGVIGSTIGSAVDSWIVSSLAPAQRIEGARLDSLRITSSTEGAVIPRLYGRMRIGGNVIWATDFREETKTTSQGGGKGGGGGKVKTTEYLYYASFAVALCEGEITGIGRVWADGKVMDMTGVTWRWYPGDETQVPDPFISAKMGAASTPAYRGTAYVMFEELDLSGFGNRLPQISFEVFRPLDDPDTAEGLVKAVTLIPASGEFSYATVPVKKTTGSGGATVAENLNAISDTADIVVALDRLQSMAPSVESVSLVVAWFGDDLRAGNCKVRPGVEVAAKTTTPSAWSVNGVSRASAALVSRDAEDRPAYGGTPADFAVMQAIKEMKARDLRVTFYPFILMDIPHGNTKPNPYSGNAATLGQPTFPWRGRITCSPAAGYSGTVDKTATAAAQMSALFGTATPANFSVSSTNVSWSGPVGEWSLRRMILHYAHLCKAAGGVDAFLIGSEMPGLTTIRSSASSYPAITAFKALAADVRAILGAGPKIGYASDWSEYFGHHPADGSGDVFFHLDPLWSDANIDFIGIDNYMPLSDWRDGFDHADAALAPAIYDRAYLQSNITGGEGFDWFYASSADRAAQVRTPITDGAAAKPWMFRFKDLRAWWQSPHFNRPGGVESGTSTAWVPQSKPIWFTELGCPAIDRGTNQPNMFFDPKSS
ncbi:glycoside hydrolase TIM-barrel-like domain-containing protein, partial [Halomonas neptunia]|nr:glycoside hydrolase TIM-barrel-like domain-containing protein [Halomonas neptunia]